jgi:putative nucleotidyltransferase with HDIG domain
VLATFTAIVGVLGAVLATVLMDANHRVTSAVAANLDAGARAYASVERRRQADLVLQAATLAESPTLKAALDTYYAEARFGGGADDVLRATVQHEVSKLASRVPVDALVIVDRSASVLASAGRRQEAWPPQSTIAASDAGDAGLDKVVVRQQHPFRVVGVPLTLQGDGIGALVLATALDRAYAEELAELARAQTAIVLHGRLIATTLDGAIAGAFQEAAAALPEQGTLSLAGERHAVRRLFRAGSADIYAVDSIDAAAVGARRDAVRAVAIIAVGALGLGAMASFWLARNHARPINELARQLRRMAESRQSIQPLPASRSSEEVDALTGTFNELLDSLRVAEAQQQAAYLGAIKALAAALDARDPYTAGHSERVSALSVMLGSRMGLPPTDLEILRLGALLHDIGKIGIKDRVLTKPGALTPEEFEIIKTHPSVGAHILRQVPMLAAHVPIVELHHERPDGRGYPHGLVGPATPLLARIVHVADAFDAMTSARAYRDAQRADYAVCELRRHRGSQFDAEVVDAFMSVWTAHQDQAQQQPLLSAIETHSARAQRPRAVGA